jgi:hypothetical protein
MSVLKSELKQLVTHEIGVRVEDAMEGAKKELAILEGRQAAFLDGSKAVEALLKSVDVDLNEGKYEVAVAEHVKRYLVRGVNALQNLSTQAMQHRLAQTGKVQAFDHTVRLLQNLVEEEKRKIAAASPPAVVPPPVDGEARPATIPLVSIKAQRLAEEVAQKASETAQAVEAAADVPEKGKKRRGRKPRAANA